MSIQLSSSQISQFQKSNLLTKCSNKIATLGNTSLKKIEPILISATLGFIVSKLTGVSTAKCTLQCLLSRALFTWISKPIKNFVKENSGLDEQGTSNKKGQNFLFLTIKIIEVALSIFLVNKFGNQGLKKIKLLLPSFLSNHLKTSDKDLRSANSKFICFVASLITEYSFQNVSLSNVFKVFVDNSKALNLPNGKMIFLTEFTNHPLFKNTNEKTEVFFQLLTYINSNFFHKNYESFLENIKTENWFQPYEDSPYTLAYLSLIAFFSNDIDQDELFIANLVAYGFKEKQSKSIQLEVGVLDSENATRLLIDRNLPVFTKNFYDYQIELNPYVEQVANTFGKDKDNIILEFVDGNFAKFIEKDKFYDYMEIHFQGFKENNSSPFLTNLKSYSDLKRERDKFLNTLPSLSPLKRTYVQHTLSSFTKCEVSTFEPMSQYSYLEQALYFEKNFRIGIKSEFGETSAKVMLLSPSLVIQLSKNATNNICSDVNDHQYMFGFSDIVNSVYKGIRTISIPSPLFSLPYPHGLTKGLTGFQMYYHDLYYHVILDMNNPHIHIICRLANIFRSFAIKEKNSYMKKFFLDLASRLVDRQVFYKSDNHTEVFLSFINLSFQDAFNKFQDDYYFSGVHYNDTQNQLPSNPPFPDTFANWLWNELTVEEKKSLKLENEVLLKIFITF